MSITDIRNIDALAESPPAATPRRVGRIKRFDEKALVKFPAGTFERIAAVLAPDEDRTDMIREAVDREVKRRERAKRV